MYTPPIWPADLMWYCAAYNGTPVNPNVQSVLTAAGATIDPTGTTDSTAGIQAVVEAAAQPGTTCCAPLYFPPGTYKITNQIVSKTSGGSLANGIGIYGAGRGVTIFSVPASTSAFSNASSPLGVFQANGENGSSNQAFGNYHMDFTIEIGANNPGAAGIDDLCSNGGGGRRVNIISLDTNGAGYAGLLIARQSSGPCLYEDFEITGFTTCVDMGDAGVSGTEALYGSTQFSVTFRNLTMNQMADTAQLFRPSTNNANIDGLTATNNAGGALTVPIVKMNSQYGGIFIINWTPGTGSGVPAIDNTNEGRVYVRNPIGTTTGWTAMVKNGSTLVPFQTSEWFSGANIPNAWGQTNEGLNIDVPAIPVYDDSSDPPSGWASATANGAIIYPNSGNNDTSVGINAAMATGAATTYMPSYQASGSLNSVGEYIVGHQIVVPVTAQRLIVGAMVGIDIFTSGVASLFEFEGPRTTPFFLETLNQVNGGGTEGSTVIPTVIYNQPGAPLVINGYQIGTSVTGGTMANFNIQAIDGATVYAKNLGSEIYAGPGSSIYVWQFDSEIPGYPWINNASAPYTVGRIWNSGGTVRVFGMKCEDTAMSSLTDSGGQTEIIGFWNLQYSASGSASSPAPQMPFYMNIFGSHSVCGMTVLQSDSSDLPGAVFWDIGPPTAHNPNGVGIAVNLSSAPILGPYALGGPFPQAGVTPYPTYVGGPVINMYSTRLNYGQALSGIGGFEPAGYMSWYQNPLLNIDS